MRNKDLISREFDKHIRNKFNLYNSLFLNLPYPNVSNIGILIPLLNNVCNSGLNSGSEPVEIMDSFFSSHTDVKSEEEKIDFMFRIIQYVERQIVLYDSVEDAAFTQMLKFDNKLSLKDYVLLLDREEEGVSTFEKLSSFSTRLVFTAHPTQFYPPSVLDIINRLQNLILNNDVNGIDISLQQLGLTSLINSQKPSPLDEARNIFYFLRNVYYDAVAELYSEVKNGFPNETFDNHRLLQLGFWPGGDRDGNPYVTSEITMDVADELRMNLMKCYYRDMKTLEKKLTFRGIEEEISLLRESLYTSMFDRNTTLALEDIINPLFKIRELLIRKYNSLFLDELDNLIDKVKIFKIHFASLDIRQNHSVHKELVESILRKENLINNNIEELGDEELISILINNHFHIDRKDFESALLKDTIDTIYMLGSIQNKNGEDGCNRYIISNSEDIFSVLFVFALLKWISWENGSIPVDIIPLFESMEGMSNSEEIMTRLFNIPEYRNHLESRDKTQTVMLGFSDGTKDGGYLQANWSIFKTKENLSAVCEEHGIKAIFFDGRGGPPSRGGGKTHRFYASQSSKIANNAIQLTIQGQTITSKYGTKDHFKYNLEHLLTAGLSHSLSDEKNNISDESRTLLENLARKSYDKYSSLKEHKDFIPYLDKKSTLKYYSKANIGSRPTKRGDKNKLELKDLRAIPFVGSWSQLKQNVPGYFGLGSAIQSLVNDGKLEELKKLFNEVPFFKALILNSMMSLSKSNFELTRYLDNDPEFKDFWNILYDEYKLSYEMTLLISSYDYLMQGESISRKSIEIREQIVLPLLVIQQYALQKIEQDNTFREHYEKIVRRSLYGNINASRNSA